MGAIFIPRQPSSVIVKSFGRIVEIIRTARGRETFL